MSAPIVDLYGGGEGAPSGTVSVPAAAVPMRRLGDEQDMAGTLLYLASRAGAYTNGAVVTVKSLHRGASPAHPKPADQPASSGWCYNRRTAGDGESTGNQKERQPFWLALFGRRPSRRVLGAILGHARRKSGDLSCYPRAALRSELFIAPIENLWGDSHCSVSMNACFVLIQTLSRALSYHLEFPHSPDPTVQMLTEIYNVDILSMTSLGLARSTTVRVRC
ncbi:short chain dehydrogenase reductase [Ilyonectria robusta]